MHNLIEKFHAIMVSPDVNIWQYHGKKEGPQFVYWTKEEIDSGSNKDGHFVNTLEELINTTYDLIDPLNKPLPAAAPPPPQPEQPFKDYGKNQTADREDLEIHGT